jgi:N-acetylmuramidase
MANQTLSAAVGPGQPNVSADVVTVQQLLNGHTDVTGQTLETDGNFGQQTLAGIVAYQSAVMNMPVPDGILSPNGPTFAKLVASAPASSSAASGSVPALLQPQDMPSSVLQAADFAAAAGVLQCEVAAIQAVATVETGAQGAFDAQGRPTILFERHYFSRLTGGAYDATNPDISNTVPGGYGPFSAQYPKMIRAATLDPNGGTLDAALRSASWGMFQIMGDNFKGAGYSNAEDFIAALRTGSGAHLNAFVKFIMADPVKLTAIRAKNWAGFAARYNGPDYASHQYDTRLAAAYAQAQG